MVFDLIDGVRHRTTRPRRAGGQIVALVRDLFFKGVTLMYLNALIDWVGLPMLAAGSTPAWVFFVAAACFAVPFILAGVVNVVTKQATDGSRLARMGLRSRDMTGDAAKAVGMMRIAGGMVFVVALVLLGMHAAGMGIPAWMKMVGVGLFAGLVACLAYSAVIDKELPRLARVSAGLGAAGFILMIPFITVAWEMVRLQSDSPMVQPLLITAGLGTTMLLIAAGIAIVRARLESE